MSKAFLMNLASCEQFMKKKKTKENKTKKPKPKKKSNMVRGLTTSKRSKTGNASAREYHELQLKNPFSLVTKSTFRKFLLRISLLTPSTHLSAHTQAKKK